MASLMSPTAFGIAASYIARYEETGEGLQWDNLSKGLGPCDNFSFSNAFGMMFFDCLLYALLLWYLNAVMPSYGLPLPWYFPLSPNYWKKTAEGWSFFGRRPPSSSRRCNLVAGPDSPELAIHGDKSNFESLPSGQEVGVRVSSLSKVGSA